MKNEKYQSGSEWTAHNSPASARYLDTLRAQYEPIILVFIETDGACSGNPGPGTTKNELELTAIE
jgi:hypothetical protein